MLNNIKEIRFDENDLLVYTENNAIFAQPLKYYPRLRDADIRQKSRWKLSNDGIHWPEIDEDVSFESFFYDADDPQVVTLKQYVK